VETEFVARADADAPIAARATTSHVCWVVMENRCR